MSSMTDERPTQLMRRVLRLEYALDPDGFAPFSPMEGMSDQNCSDELLQIAQKLSTVSCRDISDAQALIWYVRRNLRVIRGAIQRRMEFAEANVRTAMATLAEDVAFSESVLDPVERYLERTRQLDGEVEDWMTER
jgi:hypothetical protein